MSNSGEAAACSSNLRKSRAKEGHENVNGQNKTSRLGQKRLDDGTSPVGERRTPGKASSEAEEAQGAKVVSKASAQGEEGAEDRRPLVDGQPAEGFGEGAADDGAKGEGEDVERERQQGGNAADVELFCDFALGRAYDGCSGGAVDRIAAVIRN